MKADLSKFLLTATLSLGVFMFSSCEDQDYRRAAEMTGGDPARGKVAIYQYGCASCHTIPGIKGARGLVGPPLNSMADRMYIGGVIPNTPENMIRWLQNPQEADRLTAMPNLGISDSDARDIAGYIYTLR